ncbi:MAG: hypothetical protein HUU54_07930 [Ignavibacteriaceae bacterium]|nr:hypothetical protein [Ignavibacteriaceae bacterium]
MSTNHKLKLFLWILLAAPFIFPQGSDWISSLSVNPSPSSLLSEYYSNPTAGTYMLTYKGGVPVSFIFEIRITSTQYGELVYTKTVRQDFPAGPHTQLYAPFGVVGWEDVRGLRFNSAMKENILRTGRFPEGDFTLEINVLNLQGQQLTSATADFSISYPEPPQLILPQNEESVSLAQPIFQWSIVNAPPSVPVTYRIKIVEKFPSQTPSQALAANPVHHQDSVTGIGIYSYPPQGFPFEGGKVYVWQVTATDENGNIITSNNGNSEIWSYSFVSQTSQQGLPFDTLTIIDGVANLINLRRTTYAEDPGSFIISGSTTLVLTLEGADYNLNVNIDNLMIQKGVYTPPVILGGGFGANLSSSSLPTSLLGDFFRVTDISYSMIDGLTLGGALSLPGLSNQITLNGRLSVNSMGISGSLNIERPLNNPLYTFGEGIARMLINQASVHFSQPSVRLGGVFQLFGSNSSCNLQDLELTSGGTISGVISCDINAPINLIPGSDRLRIMFNSIAGDFSADLNSRSFDFNIQSEAGLELRASDTSNFGADIRVGLSSGGFSLLSFMARGNATPPAIDLGWVKLAMSNLGLSQLSYSGGNWDFSMSMDAQIIFPSFNNLTLPKLEGVVLGSSGMTIPALNLSSAQLPAFNLQAFRFEITRASMPPVTIPFFAGGTGATAGLNFGFDFRLTLPGLQGGGLSEHVFNISNATFNNGTFSFTIPSTTFDGSGIDLTVVPGIQFQVKEFSGGLSANFSGSSPVFNPSMRIRGNIMLPPMFESSSGATGQTQLNMMTSTFNLGADGRISGRMENISAACSLRVGQLQISIPTVAVEFAFDEEQQRINLEANVGARLPNPAGGVIEGSGSFNYELVNNRLVALDVQVNNPVTFNIPSSSPVFSFQLPRARITHEAVILDGRSFLSMGSGSNIGVTFRNLSVRLTDFSVASGDVVFDVPFAFKVLIESGGLRFRTVPANSQLTEDTGIMLNLPQSISLGANGFTAQGSSTVNLRFQGRSLDSLMGNFSQDFSLGLNPISVSAGQVEFALQGRRVGTLNTSGFIPDMNYFASTLLPARIPLPTENIGYLQIKEGDNILLDYSSTSTGVRLQTRDGQPIKLVLPILRFSRGTNPELDINFDIVVNTQNWNIVSGTLNVSIPEEQRNEWDLSNFGIPFNIAELGYTALSDGYGFQLRGNIKAFGNSLGDPVTLTIGANGRIQGDINLTLDRAIRVVPDNDKLVVNVSSISGSLDMQLSPLDLNFEIELDGGIRLDLGEGRTYGANAAFVLTNTGVSVEDFTVQTPAQPPRLDFSWLNLGLSDLTVPRLTYDRSSGWDFEVNLTVAINFPELNFNLPPIQNVTIRPNGITIPAISIPEISDSFRTFWGFGIKPLAFRMQRFTFDWFAMEATSLNDWGFSFDFELSLAQMPESVPEALRNARVRILNAGFSGGRITGNIQVQEIDAPGIRLPIGGSAAVLIRRIGGTLSENQGDQNYTINIGGDIQLPEFMRCDGSNGVAPVVGTELTINSNGYVFGRINGFVPPCPIDLGIGKLRITNSSLDFSFGTSNQRAIIELAGDLRLPAPTDGDSITAGGNLVFDLLNARLIDGQLSINTPFRLQIPNENPVLVFNINNAVLNYEGLRINGSSTLNLGAGAGMNANFNNFLFDYRNFRVVSGNANIMGQFALKLAVESGSIRWAAVPYSAPVTEQTAVRLSLPSNLAISSDGLTASGETQILVRVGGREYANVRCVYSEDFAISFSPFRVNAGSARLYLGQTLAGTVDRNGFSPGDILGMLPLPEKLPLPDTTIAYLKIKQDDMILVEMETVSNGVRLSTRPGQRLRLIMPGLQFGANTPPELLIAFSVTVSTSSFELVDGSISVSPSAGSTTLFNLANLGIPLSITNLAYEKINGTPVFRAGARLLLPASVGGAEVIMDSLIVNSTGFTGNVRVGTYRETHSADETYIATVNIGSNSAFKISGLEGTFSNSAIAVRLSGDITSDIFRDNSNNQMPVHWSASWGNGRFNFAFDISHIPNADIPLAFATFRPQAIGSSPPFNLELTSNTFALTLSGVLKVPSLGDDFSVSFAGLRIANDGIRVPDVSITAPSSIQNFNLFGAQFALRDISNTERAISFAYTNRTLYITLNGSLTFFGNTSTFRGLRVGSDGSLTINQASLLSNQFFVVPNYVGISRISIANSAMRVDGFVKLPQPADTARQGFYFSVNTRGEVQGGSIISIIDESPGLGGGDRTEWNFWIGKLDITYAKLNLNFANFRQSTLQVMGDIYFMDNTSKYIRLGYRQGGTPYPGFTVRFDGNIQWGNMQLAPGLTNIDWESLKLNMNQANFANDASGNFRLALTGNLSVGLAGVTGGLNFTNLRISSTGGVENLPTSVTGGVFSIANVVNLTVNNISYSSTPTFIWVKGGQMPGGSGGGAVDSQRIQVNNYFRFGASISITGVASGGIDEFLVYKTQNTTNLTIRNANLSVPGVITFRADLVYTRSGAGFYMLLGGKGRIINRYEVMVIGKVSQMGGTTSFGVFVAASGLNITMPPAIVLTQLGGGFFYNPDQNDLQVVRSMCGLDPGTTSRINSSPGRFAVLVYAQASIISGSVVSGRVLLTVTQNYFELFGSVILLNQRTYFNGTIFLHVGFTNSIAEGNINLNIDISPLVRGNAQLAFYFYPNNIWGVDGRLNVRILNVLTCNAELFVGNPGFYISMGASVSINMAIFSVDAGMSLTIWNIRDGSWGVYGVAYARGRIIGIPVCGAELRAAMINQSKSLIYGEATVELLFWDLEFWGAINDGRTSGGRGTNSSYRNQINSAVNAARNMRNQRDEALRQINNIRNS